MSDHQTAIILLAHGTPDELGDIPKYLSNVVSGRAMPDSVIEEITHRYGLIGKSPLTALTLEQARLLSDALDLPVYTGMRNWKPYIVDTVKQMKADGITRAVAICLAPQNSRTSVGLYKRAVFAEAAGAIEIDFVEGWADHPLLADAFAERLSAALEAAQAASGERPAVLFTAHSVPCRTIQTPAPDPDAVVAKRPALAPDPYPVEAKRTAAAVAARCGLGPDEWFFAFQSQGMAGGPWIGPTVENTLDALHAQGVKTVVLHTIGFLCDHVEILYDIDIAFKEHAGNLGMHLSRPASLNDSALLTSALADLARGGLHRLEGTRHGHAELTAPAPVPA
jgi:ferrochelatase